MIDYLLTSTEFIVQLGILVVLFRRFVLRKERSSSAFGPLFLSSIAFVMAADALYNFRILFSEWGERGTLYHFILETLYPLFALSLAGALASGLNLRRRSLNEWIWIGLPAFLFYEYLTFVYLTIPALYPNSVFLNIAMSLYNVGTGLVFAICLPFSLRSTDRQAYGFFQLVILILISDVAIRFQTSFVDMRTYSWAEAGWCLGWVGLFALVARSSNPLNLLSRSLVLAPLHSFRSLFAIAVCGANVLLLIGVISFRIHALDDAVDASLSLLLLYAFWVLSNEFSLHLYTIFQNIIRDLFRMDPGKGLSHPHLKKVNPDKRIYEVASILKSYNDLVDQANRVLEENAKATRDAAWVELASQVAHDIRSPLSALNLALGPANTKTPEGRIVASAIQRINEIAQSLLRRSKERSDRQRVSHIPSLLGRILDEKKLQFSNRPDIHFIYESPEEDQLLAAIDSTELGRIISNLIDNSADAIRSEGRISLSVAQEEKIVEIAIEDNGVGIPSEVLPLLGQMGFSYGKSKGNGLGLYHAKRSIEENGGKLVIESEPGKGSRVRISLPQA